MRPHARVLAAFAERERPTEQLLGPAEVAAVDERVSEQHRELDRRDDVTSALGGVEAALEDRDRRFELADHRVGAPEAVRELGVIGFAVAREREGLFEELDCLARLAFAESDLAQSDQGGNPVARLDARDVRGRAAGECELALTQSRGDASRLQALPDSRGTIYMG